MSDLEALVRDTLRERGGDITVPPAWKTPGAPSGSRHRTRSWLVPALAAAGAVALTVTIVTTGLGATDSAAPAVPATLVGDVAQAPPGLQTVSSRGIEIAVPEAWSINDTDCGQTSAPSVVRGRLLGFSCFTPEPHDKTIAEIGPADLNWVPSQDPYLGDPEATVPPPPPVMTMDATTVSGVAAELGHFELADGRTAGLLRVPSADVAVAVRAPDRGTVETILASARLVESDSAGCLTDRPDALAFLDQEPLDPLPELPLASSATVCFYPADAGDYDPRLASSAVIQGSDLAQLMDQIGRLQFDATIDNDTCSPRSEPQETVLVAARLPDGAIRYVVLAEQGCDTVAYAATHDTPALVPYELDNLLLGNLLHAVPVVPR